VVALMVVVAVAQAQQVLPIILVHPDTLVAHPKIIASSQSQDNFQNFQNFQNFMYIYYFKCPPDSPQFPIPLSGHL
jgi:hypothetical protein